MTYTVSFGGLACLDPLTEYEEQSRLGYDTSWADKANSFSCPLGHIPGKGWILLLRSALDQLDLNTKYDLTFENIETSEKVVIKQLLITKAVCLTPGITQDPNASYLVEVIDRRWSAMNKPIEIQINILAPDSTLTYYSSTVSPEGVPWTWEKVIEKVWNLNENLGDFPGLPYTPQGIPQGFQFIGVEAYQALNVLLAKINCALNYDPQEDLFSIAFLGESQDLTNLLEEKRNLLVYDGEVLESARAKICNRVRVYFNKHHLHYGQENSVTETDKQWITNSVIFKEYLAENFDLDPTTLEDNNTQVFWDDTRAIINYSGEIENDAYLNERGLELADKYYKSVQTGGARLLKKYTGIHSEFKVSGELKYVCWKITKSGAMTEIANTFGFIDGMNVISQYMYLETTENLLPPDFSRPTYPIYFPQIQIVEILEGPLENNYYRAQVSTFNVLTSSLEPLEECWAVPPETVSLFTGDILFGKISGKKEISGETKQVYFVVSQGGASGTSEIALVRVINYNPIFTFPKYDYFPAKTIKFTKSVTSEEVTSEEVADCYVAITHLRKPELNLLHIGVKIAIINGVPLYKIDTEYVRFVRPVVNTPLKGSVYSGVGYGLDYGDEGPVSILTNNEENCYINDLRFIDGVIPSPGTPSFQPVSPAPQGGAGVTEDGITVNGSLKTLDTNLYYIGRYQGILDIDGDFRPSYAVDPDYLAVATRQQDITHITKRIVFEENNFFVDNVGYGNAYIRGVLLQNAGTSLQRRRIVNFKSEKYPPGAPSVPPFLAKDNPTEGRTDVILYRGHESIYINYVDGIPPIYVDTSVAGIATVRLEIPLRVIYGGTQRTSLTRGATLIGDDINPVALRPGLPYTVFNTKYNYNYPFPEWAIWSKIQGVTQTGIHKVYGKIRPLEEIGFSSGGNYSLALHYDKYDYRYIVVSNINPALGDFSLSTQTIPLAIKRNMVTTSGTIGLKKVNAHSNTLSEYELILPTNVAQRAKGPYVYDLYLKNGRLGIRHISQIPEFPVDILFPVQFAEDSLLVGDETKFGYLGQTEGKILLENIVGLGRGGATSLTETGQSFDWILGNEFLEGVSSDTYITTKTYTTTDIILGYTYKGRLGYLSDISQTTLESILSRYKVII